jgi:N-acetylglutamate synthase-like GNAT family acetyltransferase
MDDVHISQATREDLPELLALLAAVELPGEGVEEHLAGFLVARDGGGRLVGSIGLERHGSVGLLRSAAVAPDAQGSGLGLRLTSALLEWARAVGVEEVVLLTTAAEKFFGRKFGFEVSGRDAYEGALARSPEWNLPRCSSAVLMWLPLGAGKDNHRVRQQL